MGWFDNPRAVTEHMIKEAHMVHRRDTMQGGSNRNNMGS